MNTSKAADYVWSPTNLYNATHPTSSFPWSTQWVAAPDGGQSIEVTIASGGGYYNFIAIPESYLGSGTDFKVVMDFRVSTTPVLPRYFYIFARNSVSTSYDIWQKFTGVPGEERVIELPLDLTPIAGGTWTIYVGMLGTGSLIIDNLMVEEGRGLVMTPATANATPVSDLPFTMGPLATGYTSEPINLPTGTTHTILSASGLMRPDGATPVSQTVAQQNTSALQTLINNAKLIPGKKTIEIPTGVYRLYSSAAILIHDVEDLIIDGKGSEFIFEHLFTGECFNITNAKRLKITDLYLDWNWDYKPIASLGTVVSMSGDQKTVEFVFNDLDAAQTLLASQQSWIGLFEMDPVRLSSVDGSKLAMNVTSKSASGNHITATFSNAMNMHVGKSYCIRHLYYNLIAFKTYNSEHVIFDGVTIYSLPGMGWLNTGTTNHFQVFDCHIKRRTGSRNPLTTAADGIHSNETGGNIVIKLCTFEGLGDDCINLHDNNWQGGLIYGGSADQFHFYNCPKHRLRVNVGDVLEFYNPDYSPTGIQLTVKEEPVFSGTSNPYDASAIMSVKFVEPRPTGLSYLTIVRNTRYETRNVNISGCQFKYTNGRAILLAGHDATISSCYFRNVTSTSIQLHTEIVDNLWGEGQGASNVLIKDNTFENASISTRYEGALIYAGATLPWGQTDYPLFNRILIENNRIFNACGPVATLKFSQDVVVRNNIMDLTQTMPLIKTFSGLIYGAFSNNLALGGNTWRNWITPQAQYQTGTAIDPVTTSDVEVGVNSEIDY
tara:strand:- start:160 stop:2487 length:2328 start_codon:yes stop_codon:yes gene_type:complete